MNTKLILVEGLPGFGKSTTAGMIRQILEQKGIQAKLFLEGNLDHPADHDGVAAFTKQEFHRLLKEHANNEALLRKYTFQQADYHMVRYRKMMQESGSELPELMELFSKHDIYELPFEQNEELILESWRKFAGQAAGEEEVVYVFECCFIQNPVTIGLVKWDVSPEAISSYVIQLADIVQELNPLLIYVEQDNLEAAFRKAVQERPQEWSTGFFEYYTQQGYGKRCGLQGLEGTLNA